MTPRAKPPRAARQGLEVEIVTGAAAAQVQYAKMGEGDIRCKSRRDVREWCVEMESTRNHRQSSSSMSKAPDCRRRLALLQARVPAPSIPPVGSASLTAKVQSERRAEPRCSSSRVSSAKSGYGAGCGIFRGHVAGSKL
jgi:hypothetical protein